MVQDIKKKLHYLSEALVSYVLYLSRELVSVTFCQYKNKNTNTHMYDIIDGKTYHENPLSLSFLIHKLFIV